MKTIHILILSLFIFVSCQKDNSTESKQEDDFDTFYKNFHSDSAYQIDHIQFPLAGASSAMMEPDPNFRWKKEDWNIHLPLDPETSGFRSNFTKISDEYIIETILLDGGQYGMERRFSKFGDDGWFLIYFSDLSAIAN